MNDYHARCFINYMEYIRTYQGSAKTRFFVLIKRSFNEHDQYFA
jgi:hypothetical protein